MKLVLFLAILISASVVTHSKEVEITVSNCGPLARGELGVVFRTGPQGKGQVFFVKGKAAEVCPKVIQAILVRGTESSYCDYIKSNEPECKKIRILDITEVVSE
ncbi:hypothetical protein [Microbulbifer sp. JMSA008]|uniref:hypothetical protein n=1 Tax=unclassified Microbulbifer TaxID=2619833 RepID=UPI00403A82BF